LVSRFRGKFKTSINFTVGQLRGKVAERWSGQVLSRVAMIKRGIVGVHLGTRLKPRADTQVRPYGKITV
jgi:hypothetical protein